MKMTPEAVSHNMKAAHKWTEACCGSSEKSKVAKKMKKAKRPYDKDESDGELKPYTFHPKN